MAGDELARLRNGEAWRGRVRAARERVAGDERPLDLDPRSAYELMTRQMVAGLSEELREIRQRVNGLLFVTVTAVIADVVIRLMR